MPLKIFTQEKILQTSSANSEHKHSKMKRFWMLNERIISYLITQSSKPKRLVLLR